MTACWTVLPYLKCTWGPRGLFPHVHSEAPPFWSQMSIHFSSGCSTPPCLIKVIFEEMFGIELYLSMILVQQKQLNNKAAITYIFIRQHMIWQCKTAKSMLHWTVCQQVWLINFKDDICALCSQHKTTDEFA